MRIIFVRHGHPDYVRDCLTALGRQQAEAAARRLQSEGIAQVFSSTCGRALETAQVVADAIGLPVMKCDFMREISWGSADGAPLFADGHPWTTADHMVARGESLLEPDWMTSGPFQRNKAVEYAQRIATATDEWLQTLGYVREGLYYRVTQENAATVAAFGHGGASAAILSHLFNLPFPFVCTAMGPDYTGVTIVSLPSTPGAPVSPRFELLNDARHIRGLTTDNIYGK